MGKRAKQTYAHSSEVYKQPTARKAVLIVGFVVSLVALAFAVVVLLSFFLSGVGAGVAVTVAVEVAVEEAVALPEAEGSVVERYCELM